MSRLDAFADRIVPALAVIVIAAIAFGWLA